MERFGYNTPRYARLLDSDFSSSSDACNSGLIPIQCMDRIIPQGPPGLEALELMHKKLNQFHGLISESGAAVFDFKAKPIDPRPINNELDEDW